MSISDSTTTLGELQSELSRVESVMVVRAVTQQLPGFAVDELHFPVNMMSSRAVILREPDYEAFIKGLREDSGAAGEGLLHLAGVEAGRSLRKSVERMGVDRAAKPKLFRLLEL